MGNMMMMMMYHMLSAAATSWYASSAEGCNTLVAVLYMQQRNVHAEAHVFDIVGEWRSHG
jgi:hypothetical protein